MSKKIKMYNEERGLIAEAIYGIKYEVNSQYFLRNSKNKKWQRIE